MLINHHHNFMIVEWIDKFEFELNNAISFNSDIVLTGDFNMNFLPPCKSLFTLLTLTCFTLHSNDMTLWQNKSAGRISCNLAPFFYHHSVVIQHLVSDVRKTYYIHSVFVQDLVSGLACFVNKPHHNLSRKWLVMILVHIQLLHCNKTNLKIRYVCKCLAC
jgi:hypothetical protein